MNKLISKPSGALFRLWIASYEDWRPDGWRETPPSAVALMPAESGCYSAEEAAAYLEGFNARAARESRGLWAIAVPIVLRYDGEPRSGEHIVPQPLRRS